MDSNRIKNVALGARDTLMQEVDAALERVLAPDSPERVANSQSVDTIERTVRDRGRENVVEQVAYTWFNRLCALRYMDVRGYTPVGLVSPRAGETLPAVLADARRGIYAAGLDISQRDKTAINAVLNGDTTARDPLGRAYVMLLAAACKTYERSMDYLFGAGRDLGPAIELLAPTDLLSEGSLLQRICTGLDEATCNEGVEVMGWLYQFYVSERKDEFFSSNRKASENDIAPATQLFTPNWIVRYLVENTLGSLWLLNFPDSELKDHMDYYVEPEGPEDDFLKIYSPEDITFLDPACGSGHILVYAFDLLYLMYEEEGYRPADIPELILKNNLTGIEIDDRAAEIASFCLEMKALERDPYFLSKDVDARIVVTNKFELNHDERKLIPEIGARADLLKELEHFNEIGSLYRPESDDIELIRTQLDALAEDGTFVASILRSKLTELINTLSVISNRYSVVATNPPYIGSGKMNAWYSSWIKSNYSYCKDDACYCFAIRDYEYAIGMSSLIMKQGWMFDSRPKALREAILNRFKLHSFLHLGVGAFESLSGEAVTTSAFAYSARRSDEYESTNTCTFFDLTHEGTGDDKKRAFKAGKCKKYAVRQKDFSSLPDFPISYWVSDSAVTAFNSTNRKISNIGTARHGLVTGNNDIFMRNWWEITLHDFCWSSTDSSHVIWVPYSKGGGIRRWYGNREYCVNWSNDGYAIQHYSKTGKKIDSSNYNLDYLLKKGISWSDVRSEGGLYSARYVPSGSLFDTAGPTLFCFNPDNELLALAYLNSSVAQYFLNLYNRGLHYTCGSIERLPLKEIEDGETVTKLASGSIDITRRDWDAFETSWDFTWHPLVPSHFEWVDQHTYNMNAADRQAGVERIEARFQRWERECRSRFDQLKANEEELNRIFVRIYGMEGEVPIEVPDDKVSVRLADLGRDIRSLVSYGVGCMFGRYSLDEPGLILADEGSSLDDYHAKVPNPTFEPDRTGIIPITDSDTEWFEDDIVAQFRRWLAAAYGQDTLDENVAFIERALGKSLRAYFVRDFYDDHLKTYQKRPIYWLFQSPKKGLSALVYLHRYSPNTVTTLLTEYIRPLREQMEAQARLLEVTGNARDASSATKYRATIAELDKWEHDVIFPLSQKHVALSLDDGVKANYGKAEFKGALRKVTGLN